MITLGYRDPNTGEESVVEIGMRNALDTGYWAIPIDPETLESTGPMFFALDKDLF